MSTSRVVGKRVAWLRRESADAERLMMNLNSKPGLWKILRSRGCHAGILPDVGIMFVLIGSVLAGSDALCQAPFPDAQVESNVLKALKGAPELANEAIATHTVYGTVTLTGSVSSEALRVRAETLTATANGVKRVIDELQLGPSSVIDKSALPAAAGRQAIAKSDSPRVLLSDGSYAPAAGQTTSQPEGTSDPVSTETGAVRSAGGSQVETKHAVAQAGAVSSSKQDSDGQVGGRQVAIPVGTMIRVRLNEALSSDRSQPGVVFDGQVASDVVAQGAIAIPRGATVEGRVVDARASGVLRGRGELRLELTSVTLGGTRYVLATDQWSRHSGDKTVETVNKAAGFGAVGAVVGALAGGGVGAAVGGGLGAASGVGSSAASGNGQVRIPSEGMVTFHLTAPAIVTTLSEREMERLAYGVPTGAGRSAIPRRRGGRPYPILRYGPPAPNLYPGPYFYPRAYGQPELFFGFGQDLY